MTPSSFRAPVVLIALAAVSALSRLVLAQQAPAPEDEPLPPAFGQPPTPPAVAPPPPAAPSPAPTPFTGATVETSVSPPTPPTPSPTKETASPDSYLPSLTGQIGFYHLSTAEVGPVGHVRFSLHGQYFQARRFLVEGLDRMGDLNTRLAGTFNFGFTPHESIELFGAILTSSNRNERAPEPDRRDPELIKSFGDLILGGKAVVPVRRGFTAGAELGFRFLSSISDLSLSPSSTSLWIGPVASVDFRELTGAPVRVHANANFYLDNSSNLYDFANTSRATREVAMFAYGIAASRLRFGLGVDAPLERLTAPIPLQPFVAYHAEVVTASPDRAFAGIPNDLRNRDQHWLTFGLRARVYRGLTLDAGVDVGLRSVGYEYGPPVAPYDVIFGVSYPLDVAALSRPVVVTRTVDKVPAPTMGTIVGTVKNKADGKPVSEAVVSFVGQPRARVATDPDGSFQSVPLPPGPAEVAVTAAGFEPATGKATVVAGSSATVEVALVAKVSNGNVRGKVTDRAGKGMAATLRFIGATTFEARADGTGAFSAALPAGPYRVVVDVSGLSSKEVPLDIVAGQDRQLDVTMRAANPDVTLTPQAIVLRVPIRFKPGAPKLAPGIKAELDGVADLLAEHPEIKMLRVEAHWSGAGRKGRGKGAQGADASQLLTVRQAKAIRDYLISKGAPAERIEAAGVGGDVPLVPNIGPGNQAKNRRVELVVVR
jgi:outer membrane protein OmpA-like peptidoglycan-associated protein